MHTRMTEMFGIEIPVFAFTHCREVVAAVSAAGGMGVYGASPFPPEKVEEDLAWIGQHCGGKPFGVDVMLPLKSDTRGMSGDVKTVEAELEKAIPQAHRDFVESQLARFSVPPLPSGEDALRKGDPYSRGWRNSWYSYRLGAVEDGARLQVEIALKHPIAILVSALGPPPADLVKLARERGIKLGALVGSPRHAQSQVRAGVDFIIAQGTESAAHTGDIATMVLVPEIVEAVSPIPVLAAGGIATGRQLAAALALGAEGAWTGSIWLGVAESDEPPEVIERLLAAKSSDTVFSNCRTGKHLRQLATPWAEAWEGRESPGTLAMPTQHLLTAEAEQRFHVHGRGDLTCVPMGQAVGQIKSVRPAGDVLRDMAAECEATIARMQSLAGRR